MSPSAAIQAVEDAGLSFDNATGSGVVLHMLSGLAVDGRMGLTAIGRTPDEAAMLHTGVEHEITKRAGPRRGPVRRRAAAVRTS